MNSGFIHWKLIWELIMEEPSYPDVLKPPKEITRGGTLLKSYSNMIHTMYKGRTCACITVCS